MTDEDRKKSLCKLQKALQKGGLVDEAKDLLTIIKAYKYAFVCNLQGFMGSAIIQQNYRIKNKQGSVDH